ncbi:MAG TPA: hypothetical protein DCZ94_11430 [Lentisphaeria bacterium]|nr:hypothetical protein [Lentisphaeria bacterium]
MNRNKNIKENTTGCPDHEIVCAYFDGELPKEGPESAHIASCAECQSRLEDFAKMAGAIARNMKEKQNADFPETMLKKVRSKISAEKNPVVPFYIIQFMKAAAVFILIAGIFVYIKNFTDSNSKITGSQPLRTSPPASIVSTIPQKAPAGIAGIPGEIEIRNLRDVSTSPDIRFMTPAQKEYSPDKPAIIPDSVSQVWTTDDMGNAIAKAKECLNKTGVKADILKFTADDSGTLSSSVSLNKMQLSTFVRLYAKDGFELLSPAQPQPEQNVFYGNADDKVGYEIKIVSKNR